MGFIAGEGGSETVHCACSHDCADTCSLLAETRDGVLVAVRGNPAHPLTRGFLCRKVSRYPESVYHPDRVLFPLIRTGAKGDGRFRRVSWPEAIGRIVERWQSILASDGPLAILPFFGSGNEGLINGHLAGRRFFNRLGTLQMVRTICTRAGRLGYQAVMGTSLGADPMRVGEAELIIAWGANTASTAVHQHALFAAARRNGTRLAVVNPVAVHGYEGADWHLQPRPGTDAALALAMMHVIVAEGLHDRDFIDRHTTGFDALRARIHEYPPERAEAITDVPAGTIRSFARYYATHQPAFLYVGPGCLRHSNAGETLRTITCVPALVGAWARPAGGVYFPTSTAFPVDWHLLDGEQLRPNPPASYNMIHLGRLLAGDRGIRSLYVCNGNPAAVLFNQNRLRQGLARDDLFTVVHERWLTDTARYADIVLPATTLFEHRDILFSYSHQTLLLNEPAIAPPGEARSNRATFAALAQGLGFTDPALSMSARAMIDEILALDHPALAGLDQDRLRRTGWAPAAVEPLHAWLARGAPLPTPSGRIELAAQTLAAAGRDPLPAYVPPKESRDGSPLHFRRYPLTLLTPSGHSLLNSNFGGRQGVGVTERRPTALINRADAATRGIRQGDLVEIFNDRGRCRLWADVTTATRPGVVVAAGQWWDRLYPDHGTPNCTTPDFPADMGGGSAFNSNLVDVRSCTGDRPATGAG